MKNLIISQFNRIPEPTRTGLCVLAFIAFLFAVFAVLVDASRRYERRTFERESANATDTSRERHATSTAHEQSADTAAAGEPARAARKRAVERAITANSKLREQSRARTEESRRAVHAIRNTPADTRRPVDDARRRDLSTELRSLYPELIGEGYPDSEPRQ